jgi:hypothetical protein
MNLLAGALWRRRALRQRPEAALPTDYDPAATYAVVQRTPRRRSLHRGRTANLARLGAGVRRRCRSASVDGGICAAEARSARRPARTKHSARPDSAGTDEVERLHRTLLG